MVDDARARGQKRKADKQYNKADRKVKRSYRKDKRQWMEERVQEAEEATVKLDMKSLYDVTKLSRERKGMPSANQ